MTFIKQKTLQKQSKNYQSVGRPYVQFKEAEDRKGEVMRFLKNEIKKKVVLDIGCGEGTQATVLAPLSKRYYAIDSSLEQLKRAKRKCRGIKNITFLHSSAENISLQNNSIDVAICSWVISVIRGRKRKSQVLTEIDRVLKPGGIAILAENDWQGEFERIRYHPKRTKRFNEWLITKGFKVAKNVHTYFEFDSPELTKQVFEQIWGKRVSNKIKKKRVEHRVVIFKRQK